MPIPSCSICFETLLKIELYSINTNINQASGGKERDETADDVSTTPCGHVFHTKCVLQWVQTHRHCPQCRRQVLSSSLVKLFLAEDGGVQQQNQHHRLQRASGVFRDDSNPFETFVIISAEEHRKNQSENEDKLINDVMQCQLEDLEKEVQNLRKQLGQTDDHLQEKVQEISSLESKLVSLKRKEILREKERRELTELKNQRILANSQTESRLSTLRDENQRLSGDLEARNRVNRELERKLSTIESEVQIQTNMISQLQGQLEASNRVVEVQSFHSIYESVNDESNYSEIPVRKKKKLLNCCTCLKNSFIIIVVVAILLCAFVVLPLKLIFASERVCP